jgi:UDP-galactopyranose mutase
MATNDFLIVGAGITGLTLADKLAHDGKTVLVIDFKNHIGGNCYDYEDDGILVQKYGPHIFHTKDKKVFDYLKTFAEFNDYRHKVISYYKGKYFPVPINRNTVNMFYGIDLKTEDELKAFLEKIRENKTEIQNSRDVVVSKFGNDLYEAFVKHYTKKQWDLYPEELDTAVLERLPIRYNTVPYYFDDDYQGMPIGGYTRIFEKMVKHPNIEVRLNTDFFAEKDSLSYKHLIFTGRIDQYFSYKFGKLDYRCMHFDIEKLPMESFQPNAVVNYTEDDVKFTRITEYKKFYFQEKGPTVICREFPSWEGDPSYPVMNGKNREVLAKYLEEAKHLRDVSFAGRLGTYRYINMDKAVADAFTLYEKLRDAYTTA